MTEYESTKALEEVQQRQVLKQHIDKLRPLVESSSPALYAKVYTAGEFK